MMKRAFLAVLCSEVGHAALGGVYGSTTELLLSHVFAYDGLHYRRTYEEHVGDAFRHDGEVSEGRTIYSTVNKDRGLQRCGGSRRKQGCFSGISQSIRRGR